MEEQTIVPEVLLDKAIELGLSFSDSAFPIGIFPSEIRNIIADVHECQGFPIDYIASAMLVAIAVGIGNTHLVQFKRGWQESAMLYVALVGRPGTNKSHPLSFAMKPFLDFDYQENKLYEQAYSEYDKVVRMSRKERIEAGHSEQPTEPIRRRFIVSDITPEGLSFIHAQNKRGLCLWTDELSAWFKNFNRYNSGSEEQFWLSVFSAKATISDRKGNRSSIFIKRPFISVVGTIQKKILGELSKGERSSNGFIDRILFVIPNLQQKARWSKTELPESTEGRVSFSNLLRCLAPKTKRANSFLRLSPLPKMLRLDFICGKRSMPSFAIPNPTKLSSGSTVSWKCMLFAFALSSKWLVGRVPREIRPRLTLFLWSVPSLLPSIFATRHSRCTQRLQVFSSLSNSNNSLPNCQHLFRLPKP